MNNLNNINCEIYKLVGVSNNNTENKNSKGRVVFIKKEEMTIGENIDNPLIDQINITDEIHGEVRKCQMSKYYLSKTKKIPYMYIDIFWGKGYRTKFLQRLIIYFNIEDYDKKMFMNEELLLDTEDRQTKLKHYSKIKGIFTIELLLKELHHIDDIQFESFDKAKKCLIDLALNDEIIAISKNLAEKEYNKIKEEYGAEMDQYKELPKATITLLDLKNIKNNSSNK
jgi:hypothetical protein